MEYKVLKIFVGGGGHILWATVGGPPAWGGEDFGPLWYIHAGRGAIVYFWTRSIMTRGQGVRHNPGDASKSYE